MSDAELISGTPVVAGAFTFTVQATSSSSPTAPTAAQQLTITITTS
jgi:hypothetical protein